MPKLGLFEKVAIGYKSKKLKTSGYFIIMDMEEQEFP
jgi:hypothetical protein